MSNNNKELEVKKIFDEKGNLIKEIYPDGRVYGWEYDEKGNVIKQILPNGDEYVYKYDENEKEDN